MRLDAYVNYRGTCEAAFHFYEQHLVGRITGIVRHSDMPQPQIPKDWQDKITHARIEIGNAGGGVTPMCTFTAANQLDHLFVLNVP
jgi:PhnB protein